MSGVTRIGRVAVGGYVSRTTSRRAQVYRVHEITARHIRLVPVSDLDGHSVSVPVGAYRSLTPVSTDDPRLCGQSQ